MCSSVERRRRDNINDRIAELGALLPVDFGIIKPQRSTFSDVSELDPHCGDLLDDSNDNTSHTHKGEILRRSVDYIKCVLILTSYMTSVASHCSRYLQQLIQVHQHRNSELEMHMRAASFTSTNTSEQSPQALTQMETMDEDKSLEFDYSALGI